MTALALGSFAEERPFRAAIARAQVERRRVVGLWSPCAVELGEIGAEAERGIAPLVAAAGVAAAIGFYALIWWSATIAYPLDLGGRPPHSWQVFLIAPIEVGALVAGVAGLLAFLWRARLTRLHDGAFDLDEVRRASSDRFVIAIACDAGEEANAVLALLAHAGAAHSRLVTP